MTNYILIQLVSNATQLLILILSHGSKLSNNKTRLKTSEIQYNKISQEKCDHIVQSCAHVLANWLALQIWEIYLERTTSVLTLSCGDPEEGAGCLDPQP